MTQSTTHIFRASLKPKLYRDIEIEGTRSLGDLAEAIVGAFDFSFDHAFGFYSNLGDAYHKSPEQYELFADMEDSDSQAKSVKGPKGAPPCATLAKKRLYGFYY